VSCGTFENVYLPFASVITWEKEPPDTKVVVKNTIVVAGSGMGAAPAAEGIGAAV
jgi:hypothetical protein